MKPDHSFTFSGTTEATDEKWLRLQKAALEAAANSIAITDRDGKVLWINRAYADSYGYSKDELIGKSPGSLIRSGHHDNAFYREMWQTITAGNVWSGEIVNKRRDGKLLTEDLTITPVRDESGEIANFIAFKTDLTERKLQDEQVLRAQRMESIGTLAGGIAHDLNNLLAPIMMGVDYLEQEVTNERSLSILDSMGSSVVRGTNLVRQILSFARGHEGSRLTLILDDVVAEVESLVETSFPKNIQFIRQSTSDLWPVRGDPTQLNQVVLNLAVNACDALPDGGHIRVTTSNIEIDDQYAAMNPGAISGRYVALEVKDDGHGMTEEVRKHIFDPFFTTKEVGKGTGLGLSTVIGIIRGHNGFIEVHSEVGIGSTFVVYVPVQEGVIDEESPESLLESLPRGNGERILVVDDELSILTITRHTLETFGYRVLEAEDGAQAIGLFALHRRDIALVLTDMVMPAMDGRALIKALKRIDPAVRIIAASGKLLNQNMTRVKHEGIKYVLEKPYSAERLLVTIQNVLASRT